jgi:small subunit ribosomal protein S20
MANTRTSAKRARQAVRKNARNQSVRTSTRSALRVALDAIKTQDTAKAKEAYGLAIKALSKAASKGSIPKGRAARKISRLTLLVKRSIPTVLPQATSKR